jgi:5-formyltetrahydrofolate cyclo-ligase
MFEYLRFRRELMEIERWQRKADAKYKKDIAAARKRGAMRDEVLQIESLAQFEDRTADEDIQRAHTRYLWREAHRLFIPTPHHEDEESWEEVGNRQVLTRKGINDLRAAIRAEKKVRREQVLMWVPAATALTGLAGAAIGVIAAWFGFGTPK